MTKNLLSIALFAPLLSLCAFGGTNNSRASFEIRKEMMDVTIGDKVVMKIPCERIQLDTPCLNVRGEANVARSKNGDIYTVLRGVKKVYKSTDGGRTWTYIPLDFINNNRSNHFTILNDDTFILIWVNLPDKAEKRTATTVYRSTDYGKTWEVASKIKAYPYDNINEGAQSITQISDGTILYPVARWIREYSKLAPKEEKVFYDKTESGIFCSKDKGQTWYRVLTFKHVGEPHIIELQSGKLLGAFRYQRKRIPTDTAESVIKWNGYVTNKYQPKSPWVYKNIFIGESNDKGKTWENLRPVQDKFGNALVVHGECHGQLVQVPDNRVVVTHDHRFPYHQYQVMARVSNDEGKTWEPEVYRLSFGNGYPSSVALEDGTIITVTGNTPLENDPHKPLSKWGAQVVRGKVPEKKTKISRKKGEFRRIIVNNDGAPLISPNQKCPMGIEGLIDEVFTPFEGSHVDAIFWALGSTVDGINASNQWSHRTKNGEIFGENIKDDNFPSKEYRRRTLNLRYFFKRDTDPPEIIINHAHKIGMEAFISIRMNDSHEGIYGKHYVAKIKRQHPEWTLGDRAPIKMFRFALDFMNKEARNYRMSIIKEAIEQYDLDGFELDFIRHPIFFAPKDLQKGVPVMNQFVRDVRGILDKVGKQKGKFLELAVRVPPTFELSMNAGLDVKTWIDEGLIDILTPGIVQASMFNLPVEEFVEATKGTKVQVHPHLGITCMASRVRMKYHNDAVWRAQAALYWRVGVDGLYSFNANCITYFKDPNWNWQPFKEIGDPSIIEFMDKHYLVDHNPKTNKSYEKYVNVVMPPSKLSAMIKADKDFPLTIKIADDLEKAKAK
ncbi:MAG: hypothetical protein ACYSSI_13210, partial [Planctomycetota bacterium]